MARTHTINADASLGYDQGLRTYFLNIMLIMGVGLAITGGVSWWISHSEGMMHTLFNLQTYVEDGETKTRPGMSGWFIAASLIQLGMVWRLSWGAGTASRYGPRVTYGIFFAYAALSGVTIAPVLYAYTDASVATVFFLAAATFGCCALFGHTTKIDLRPLGTFFLMALIGLLLAMVVNIFLRSPAMDFMVSIVGVLLFAALTAFDMQKLEQLYDEMGTSDGLIVYGALTLYLDFINMFLFLLRLFGARRD
jgi:hypothetical protein